MEARRNRLVTVLLAGLLLGSKGAFGVEPRSFLVTPGVSPGFQRALAFAADMLARPGCQAVLTDFHDDRGRTLLENLDELGLKPSAYLAQVYFTAGGNLNRCNDSRVLASTSPGSRVVFVCGMQFQSVQRQDTRYSAYTIIHEMLHTLGLGENPPTPREITERVRMRCSRAEEPQKNPGNL